MNRARIRIDAQTFTSKVALALDLVALCSVDWKPVKLLKILAGEVLLHILACYSSCRTHTRAYRTYECLRAERMHLAFR
jgi:hypothetical protein